ncbi:MAG: serine/threonine protein kinase [Planctomycetales bacterium]|nr:serine/threonine protein kinase [Planctomycetales bacterium]
MSHSNSADPSSALADGRQPAASRFRYATGDRPLDGYTIKRGVGVGGFGEVYYATTDAGKDVALKRIQRNLEIELRGVRQCLNLKHPNLLSLYDIKYDNEGEAWVVMEYDASPNLQEVLERNPNGMPLDQVHVWFDGTAAGVAHLHDCGIVHRDLKPGNIFLDQGDGPGTVKVCDYGLSKFISCSRRSGQTQSVGTFHYMAPEIGQGKYGKEIDIYALGIMLYEMLTGHLPYDGESSQEIIMKHLTARPDLSRVPSAYRDIIERALQKSPDLRYDAVNQMRAAMAAFAPGPHAKPHRPPTTPPPLAGALADEPIAQAVRSGVREVSARASRLGTFAKFGLLVVGILLLMGNVRWLVPYSLFVGFAYFVYLGIRSVVLANAAPIEKIPPRRPAAENDIIKAVAVTALPDDKHPRPGYPAKPRRRLSKAEVEERIRSVLGQERRTVKAADFTGSLIMSSLVASVVGVAFLLVGGNTLQSSVWTWLPTYAWTTLSSIAGAWSVLSLSKMWEGTSGDAALRRFTLLVTGMGVGLASFLISQFLMVRPTYLMEVAQPLTGNYPSALHHADGLPTLFGFMAYFGGLFMIIRWWRQADPLRRVRLGFWSTVVTVAASVALHALCPVPRGFVIAATTSLAIQLSAPWLTAGKRRKLSHQATSEVHA